MEMWWRGRGAGWGKDGVYDKAYVAFLGGLGEVWGMDVVMERA